MRLVIPDGAQEHIPLRLPGVNGFLRRSPGDVGWLGALVLVEPGSRGMDVARELRSALRPMNIGGEVVMAVGDVASGHEGLGAVREGVFDGVAVEGLAAIGASGKAPANAVGD